MGATAAANNHHQHHQVFDMAVPQQPAFKCFDDDGRLKRTGYNLNKTKISTFFVTKKKKTFFLLHKRNTKNVSSLL